jgi:hypothetical protein
MALTSWGFIYTGSGNDPSRTRAVLGSDACKLIAVGIEKPEQGLAVAQQMVADGVQLIELCGGFGPVWTAKIIAAIDDRVPVGSVGYGPETIARLHAIFG